MSRKIIKVEVSDYEYVMLEDMKHKKEGLEEGELSFAGDIFLTNAIL